ncbi:MAG: MFS transporter [Sulfolobales archaeon]
MSLSPFLARSMGFLSGKTIANIGSKGRKIREGFLDKLAIYREEVLLNLATLCFFLTIHSVAPYLSQYAVELGATEAMIALLGPFFAASAITFRLVSGILADRGWTQRLLIFGAAISSIAQAIYFISTNMEALYAGRFVQGVAVAIFIPASFQAAAIGDKDRVISSLAWRNTVTGISFALGPALGGYISQHLGYKALFAYSSVLGAISAILVLLIGGNRFTYNVIREERQQSNGELFLSRNFLTALISLLLYSSSYMCLSLFLPAYHKQAGLGASIIAIYFTLMAGFNLLSRLTFRYILKILSVEGTAMLGIAMVSMGYLAISLDPLSINILYYGILTGIGAGLAIPSLQIIAITGIPQERRGLASAIYTAMFDLGNLVGPMVASALANTYRDMISIGGYLTIASAAPIAMLTAKSILTGRSVRQ